MRPSGAAFQYVDDLYFAGNTGSVYKISRTAVVGLIESSGFGTLACRNAHNEHSSKSSHTSCVGSVAGTVEIQGPVVDTNFNTGNNDGAGRPRGSPHIL